jgi:hypothetical protein
MDSRFRGNDGFHMSADRPARTQHNSDSYFANSAAAATMSASPGSTRNAAPASGV